MIDKEKLAYWVGVVQTDGFIHRKGVRKNPDATKIYVSLGVGIKSMSMLEKFQRYSKDIFNLGGKPFYVRTHKLYVFRMGATRLKEFFKEHDIDFSDPPKPPNWITENKKYIGAYIAGIIDGDGDIRIKRRNYPQCVVRICSGKPQEELENFIIKNFNCTSKITKRERTAYLDGRTIKGISYYLEFYLSVKNLNLINDFVVGHIAIDHKREKIKNFIEKRYAPAAI